VKPVPRVRRNRANAGGGRACRGRSGPGRNGTAWDRGRRVAGPIPRACTAFVLVGPGRVSWTPEGRPERREPAASTDLAGEAASRVGPGTAFMFQRDWPRRPPGSGGGGPSTLSHAGSAWSAGKLTTAPSALERSEEPFETVRGRMDALRDLGSPRVGRVPAREASTSEGSLDRCTLDTGAHRGIRWGCRLCSSYGTVHTGKRDGKRPIRR